MGEILCLHLMYISHPVLSATNPKQATFGNLSGRVMVWERLYLLSLLGNRDFFHRFPCFSKTTFPRLLLWVVVTWFGSSQWGVRNVWVSYQNPQVQLTERCASLFCLPLFHAAQNADLRLRDSAAIMGNEVALGFWCSFWLLMHLDCLPLDSFYQARNFIKPKLPYVSDYIQRIYYYWPDNWWFILLGFVGV